MQPTTVEKHCIPPNAFTLGLLAVSQTAGDHAVCVCGLGINSSVEERNFIAEISELERKTVYLKRLL